MNIVEQVEETFRAHFKEQPLLVRSPGRINLIGEHTDYNMGYVLPAAIEKAIYFAITPRNDRVCVLHALDLSSEYTFAIDNLKAAPNGWPNYLIGVVDQFMKSGNGIKPDLIVFLEVIFLSVQGCLRLLLLKRACVWFEYAF